MEKMNVKFESNHNIIDFPLRVCFNDSKLICNNIGNFVYCHWHHEYEFNLITKGKAVFEIDGKPIAVQEGDIIVVNSNEVHCGYTPDNTQCCLYGVIFSLEMLSSPHNDAIQRKYLDPILQKQYRFPSLIRSEAQCETKAAVHLREIIWDYFDKPFGFELKIKAILYNILSEIISNHTLIKMDGNITRQIKLEKFRNVLKYIEDNYKSRIYVEDLAATAGMSTDNFFKHFKRITGETPVNYIKRTRIREASRLLRETKLSVLDIALDTGFENVSYFIKTFKKSCGMTPKEFRKNNK